jgi:hypothetical protein
MSHQAPTHADCFDALRRIPDHSVSLIIAVAPPPSLDASGSFDRESHLRPYVAVALELKRILRPRGTFLFGMRHKMADGPIHGCADDVVDALAEQGWGCTEDWACVWQPTPATSWTGWFADAWMRVDQFNLQKHFDMYQDAVRVPMAESTRKRIAHLSEKDKTRQASATGSGFGKKISNWVGRETVYPTNVIDVGADEPSASNIPAVLAEFFVKLFSAEGDIVLDPFGASPSFEAVAVRLGRRFLSVGGSGLAASE